MRFGRYGRESRDSRGVPVAIGDALVTRVPQLIRLVLPPRKEVTVHIRRSPRGSRRA